MLETGRCIVMDVDGTLCTIKTPDQSYAEVEPRVDVVAKLREYRADGWYVILQTSRNMRTFDGNVGRINAMMLPTLIEWLDRHDIPYDEVHVAKPWAGSSGFYVDDRAVRPGEFVRLPTDQLLQLVSDDRSEGAVEK